ncbi:hypothetical protein [Rhodohalobacter sp. 8-1]|uniref:hypothetical protein n=1 Tax=Rhodohalobacter sp. 8-1 TaxID=3131972 RepID=UPI0030EE941B
MYKVFATTLLLFAVLTVSVAQAQFPEGTGDRYIRIAEMGQLVDSVNVWGDVSSSGRYLVPEGTNLPDLISFSLGYTQLRDRRDGSVGAQEQMIEVKVSRFDNTERVVEVAFFRYRNRDPEPIELFEFDLQNNDIVTLKISRVPTFTDYVRVIAPILGTLATSILLIERLRGD